MSATQAFIRRPSARLAEGELTHFPRASVDVPRAYAQHAAYLDALCALGLTLVTLPELPDQPDGVFVEDVLVVLDGQLVLTRPGAASRRGELASVEATLQQRQLAYARIAAPATLDGGDVLVLSRHVLVGQSSRSNDAARAQLAALIRTDKPVLGIAIERALHLKSVVTSLPDGSLIAAPGRVDTTALAALGYRVQLAAEPSGANVLCVGKSVVLPADAPRTAATLRQQGFDVLTLEISELQKLEAGLTCMSVLWQAAPSGVD